MYRTFCVIVRPNLAALGVLMGDMSEGIFVNFGLGVSRYHSATCVSPLLTGALAAVSSSRAHVSPVNDQFWRPRPHYENRPKMCLLGVSICWHASPFSWSNPQKTPILEAWIGIFKANRRNLESCILSKLYYTDSNQILHDDKVQHILLVGCPNTRTTNPRWLTAAVLKKMINRHISATYLTDRHKI